MPLHLKILPNGIAIGWQLGNYGDDMLVGLSRLAQAIHASGGRVAAHAHAGAKANPKLFPEEREQWGPSALPDPLTGNTPKEMTKDDVRQVVLADGAAALRAKKAGFDAVQLHAAHGYGINQFLSGASNRRSDACGGDITWRYRFLGEVMECVRGAVGKDYPLFVKLSGNDYFEGGLTTGESLYVACRLVEDGIDCIEVSAGSRASADGMVPSRMNIWREEDEGYLADFSRRESRRRLSQWAGYGPGRLYTEF